MIFEVDGVDIDAMLKEMNKGKIEIRNKDGVKIISCATCDDKDKQITELKQIVEVCKEALKIYESGQGYSFPIHAKQALDKISELTKEK